jgi:hypothetical protein
MPTILRTNAVSRFSCLGDRCEDTCCKGWSMQVDEQTLARYKSEAPELLSAVEPGAGGADAPWIMRKDPASGHCVKFEGGLCGVHKQYGDRMLGDACHFYPRITRGLGEQVTMSGALSCPEIARLTLLGDEEALAFAPVEIDRLPHTLKNYLPENMDANDALAVHNAFLQAAGDTQNSAEQNFARIASVSRSIERIDKKGWAQALPMYLRLADGRLPPPDIHIADPFNLLHALAGLITASKKKMSPRLQETVGEMEKALKVTLDWEQVLILTDEASLPAYRALQAGWQEKWAAHHQPLLRKYLQMQLSMALYPFAGLGGSLTDRVTLIGVRLATIRLALMCATGMHGGTFSSDTAIRIVQSLSRFMDHLGDPAFSLQIYGETGWTTEARMRGLLAE